MLILPSSHHFFISSFLSCSPLVCCTNTTQIQTSNMSRLMAASASRKLTPSFLLKHTSISPAITPISSKPIQNPNSPSPANDRPQTRPYSTYMNQLFPKSNSSFNLTTGNSIQSNIVKLSEDVFLVDSGIGTPRICLKDELILPNKNKIRFQNRVGYLDLASSGEPQINKQLLERFFIDLVAGDSIAKERATARFNELVGGSPDLDAIAKGEPLLVLPRRYRQKRVLMDLNKVCRNNGQVKGFIVGRVRGGYSVAIAGFIAFLPFRPLTHSRRMLSDRFSVESINNKTGNIRVL